VYNFLRGEKEQLDLTLVLDTALSDPDFLTSLLDAADIAAIAEELVTNEISDDIPEEMRYLLDYVDEVVAEYEPWIRDQASRAVPPMLDYLLGISPRLNVVIDLEPIRESLEDTLRQIFLQSPPATLAGLTPAQLEQYFNQHYTDFSALIPATLEINEELLGTETPQDLATALADAEELLTEARRYVGFFLLGFRILIGVTLLLVIGIILLWREVPGTALTLGIIFLCYGLPWYIGTLVVKYTVIPQQIPPHLPSTELQRWSTQLSQDALAPLEWLSLGLLITGGALIVVSVVYRRRRLSE